MNRRVQSAEEWRRLCDLAEQVFDLASRLPSVVSHLEPADAPFFDGDVVFGEIGWSLASSLAFLHDDPVVNLVVVDPESSVFLEATGEYGGFSCPSSSSSESYTSGLFGVSRGVAGQIGYAAETVAIFGASGRWGIWVQRNIAGLVVSACPQVLGAWELELGPFLSTEDALDGFLGLNLGDAATDSEFARTLRRNYGTFRHGR